MSNGQPLVAPITVASITGLDKVNNNLPVSYQYSFGVQHALSSRTVLELQYVGNQNRDQNAYLETNLPSSATISPRCSQITTPTTTQRVPYLGFHSIRQT